MATRNINAFLKLVRDYLAGKSSRLDIEWDLTHEFMQRYEKMAAEDEEYTDLINERILEDGVERGRDLSDEEFYDLIKYQYNEVKDIVKSGFF